MQPTGYVIFLLSVLLLFNPGSKRIFALLLPACLIDAVWQMPVTSNHTILKDMTVVAFCIAGLWHWLKGSDWEDYLKDALPVCRSFLLTMYVFGVFHKINAGFLSPETSCAVVLWRVMPYPLNLIGGEAFYYFIIYGTLVVETALITMLLMRQTRYWAIMAGIGFHILLAFSGYAMYAIFSSLSISLHLLFVSPAEAWRVTEHPAFAKALAHARSFKGWIFFGLWFAVMFALTTQRDYAAVGLVWALVAVPLAVSMLALMRGRGVAPPETPGAGRLIWSPLQGLNILAILFFLNCAMPYAGLKTSQAMNMFANLDLEGGASNHLVFSNPPRPFHYLEDVVELKEVATADGRAKALDVKMVYYALLNEVERKAGLYFTCIRNGVLHEKENARMLARISSASCIPAGFAHGSTSSS